MSITSTKTSHALRVLAHCGQSTHGCPVVLSHTDTNKSILLHNLLAVSVHKVGKNQYGCTSPSGGRQRGKESLCLHNPYIISIVLGAPK